MQPCSRWDWKVKGRLRLLETQEAAPRKVSWGTGGGQSEMWGGGEQEDEGLRGCWEMTFGWRLGWVMGGARRARQRTGDFHALGLRSPRMWGLRRAKEGTQGPCPTTCLDGSAVRDLALHGGLRVRPWQGPQALSSPPPTLCCCRPSLARSICRWTR